MEKLKVSEAAPEEHTRVEAVVCGRSGKRYHLRNQPNHSVRLSADLAFRTTEKIIRAPRTASMPHRGTAPLTHSLQSGPLQRRRLPKEPDLQREVPMHDPY